MTPLRQHRALAVVGLLTSACASTHPGGTGDEPGVRAAIIPITQSETDRWFSRLASVIGERDIVLLGENGHGVGQFTSIKAELVTLLHERLGFDLVVFESPFYDCEIANQKLVSGTPVEAARGCLITQLQHQEIKPLFKHMAVSQAGNRPLDFAGMDLQIMLYSARSRPGYLRDSLRLTAPNLGDRLARLDSALIEQTFKGVDSVITWINQNGATARAMLDSAASQSAGTLAWILRTEATLLDRLMLRGIGADDNPPARYYELRDEWMARTIAWLADSAGARRKVVVWLHNDHARYGGWATPAGTARAAGQFLKSWFPGRVFSVGYLMGRGTVADNSRRPREIIPHPPGSIEETFRSAGHPMALLLLRDVPGWAAQPRPYIRAFATVDSMRFGREFDALVFVDSVGSPAYGIR